MLSTLFFFYFLFAVLEILVGIRRASAGGNMRSFGIRPSVVWELGQP